MMKKTEVYRDGKYTLRRGTCHECKKKCKDLSLFKGRYLCRNCLCPDDYDPQIIENLAAKASRRKWNNF